MRRRYYSHYTYIHPDIYLKNYVIGLDYTNHIIEYFPFEKEVESTEFYSGMLIFLPQNISITDILPHIEQNKAIFGINNKKPVIQDVKYSIYNEDGCVILSS